MFGHGELNIFNKKEMQYHDPKSIKLKTKFYKIDSVMWEQHGRKDLPYCSTSDRMSHKLSIYKLTPTKLVTQQNNRFSSQISINRNPDHSVVTAEQLLLESDQH